MGRLNVDEQRLWAPWRMGYVSRQPSAEPSTVPTTWLPEAEHSCFLCRSSAHHEAQAEADKVNLVVARTLHTLVILNRYPYNNGHLLIAPLRHVGGLGELSPDEHQSCMDSLAQMMDVLSARIKAQGFNIGLNQGEVAGAGVPGHLHWHLVPRWAGDKNFMPVVSDTHVISQSLEALWETLMDPPTDGD